LTVGMAVDANIIINERIKEELARGASFKLAVQQGYAKAFNAIFDSNLTVALTSLILFYYGTGPVRGFAVTLIMGMVASMFTAVFMTHAFVDFILNRTKAQRISI
jgi:protein-export membrane protein SecD